MKKFLSLILSVVLTLSLVSTASAVEIINKQTEGSWELCSWMTNQFAYLTVQKHGEADEALAINVATTKVVGLLGNGKIQRARNRHLVILAEDGQVSAGHAAPVWCKLEFVELKNSEEQDEFDAFGIVTVEDIEDSLTEAVFVTTSPEGDDIYAAYYRGVEVNLANTKENVDVVAKIYIDKQYFHVLLVDYDGDGDRELALHLGLMSTSSSSSNTNKDDKEEDKDADFTIGGESSEEDNSDDTDFTIGTEDTGDKKEEDTSNGGGTDFTIGGSPSSTSNDSGSHSGWSDALTNNGSSAKTESTDSTGGTGFTIQ